MKVLGISGSPRRKGNTEILLDRILEGSKSKGAEIEKIILNKLKFVPCQECEDIKDDGTCIIEDDMQFVYEKIKHSDALILASPIFFGSLSAQTKMMIDRFQCLWRAKYMLNIDVGYKKIKGVFVSVEASDRQDFFNNAKAIVKNLFSVINVEYSEELLCTNIDKLGSILKHPRCMEKAFQLGKNIVSSEG